MQKVVWFTGPWHSVLGTPSASVQQQFSNWLNAKPNARVVSHAMSSIYAGKGLEGQHGTICVVYEEVDAART